MVHTDSEKSFAFDILPILEQGQIGIWEIYLPIGKGTVRGAACLRTAFGLEAAELVCDWQDYLASYCHPDEREHIAQVMQEAMEDGASYRIEHRVWNAQQQDWHWAYFFGKTHKLLDEAGYCVRGGMVDIHKRMSSQLEFSQIREADERTQIMLDATPLCCNFWDENFNNIDCNQEAANLFELSSKQEYLDRFNELSPEYQPDGQLSSAKALQMITTAFRTGRVRFEWMHQKPNGEPVPSEITLVRVKRGDSYIVAGYTRDLRELKAMLAEMQDTENKLRVARDAAEQSARAKSDFLANMSHEIRTPMNAILGMTHLALRSGLTQKQHYYIEKTQQSAKNLLRIINDILDFSKIEAGKLEIESVEFPLEEVLRGVADVAMGQIQEKDLELLINVPPALPEVLLGDSLHLNQVLLNLVNNAIKFTEKGSITLDVVVLKKRKHEIELQFSVKDTGIGMDEEQMQLLFTPFNQADTSVTRRYGGTGLGLAICKNLVSMMHGSIWCESMPHEGTTFFFTATFGLPGEIQHLSRKVLSISALLLGDNDASMATIREHLLMLRCKMLDSGTGPMDALDNSSMLSRAQLIIMDWKNPETEGVAAIEELHELLGENMPPVLFASQIDVLPPLPAHIHAGILKKPVTLSSMYDSIVNAINHATTKEAQKTENEDVHDSISAHLQGARILLAEDNEINQLLAVELLTMEGFEVDVAGNGLEALELLSLHTYDLVLMDIQMPEMDGLATTAEIRKQERYKDLPIIAMTAHAMAGDRDLSLEAGMNDHITKPIDPTLLYQTLGRWIER